MKKIAFVIPWYGENIPGGAEAELRGVTTHLHAVGVDVEILTTCVKEFSSDWNVDYYPEGVEIIYDIPVRRFKVRKRDVQAFDAVNYKLITNQKITDDEEQIFIKEMVNSPRLYQYIKDNQHKYDLFVYIPYMFGTTYYGINTCPEKAVIIPCFHKESYVYMNIFKELFPKVRGAIYNADAEYKLANSIYDFRNVKQKVMGLGLETGWIGKPERFREKYDINQPFILYAGRKDAGKQVDLLLYYFAQYKERNHNDMKLVLLGGGEINIPETIATEVIDLGFVDIQDKYDAYTAAMVLCQPSLFESFSIVIMESWLAGRPVLVNSGCDVTTDFAHQSGGGFAFENYDSFERYVNEIMNEPEMAIAMGQNGRKYVISHFSWDAIVEKYISFFEELID